MKTQLKAYRQDIQVLRGIAILSVLIYLTSGDITSGYLGVDVFFVISGFVITPLLKEIFDHPKIAEGVKAFLLRRFFRLAPAQAIAIIFLTIAMFLFFGSGSHGMFAKQGIAQYFLLGNFSAFWFEPDYFNSGDNPLIHTWSLSVEEQIYIFVPLMLWVAIKNANNIKRLFVIFFNFNNFKFISLDRRSNFSQNVYTFWNN